MFADSSRWSERSVDHRKVNTIHPQPRSGARISETLQGPESFQSLVGGLRCAPTTGYYLPAFQAEVGNSEGESVFLSQQNTNGALSKLNPDSEETFLGGRVVVIVGDLIRQDVDAIVNAANSSLLGGGGVDGAIHRAGGPEILEACREIRKTLYPSGLPTGEAVITTAGNLIARHVIHTVGPVYGQHDGRESQLLAACYENSLRLAVSHSLISIAFPAISTGAFGYPQHEAAKVSSEAIQRYLQEAEATNATLNQVRLIFRQQPDAEKFLKHHRFS